MGRELRKSARRSVSSPGAVFGTNGKLIVECRLRDVSVSGVQFVLEQEADIPKTFLLAMSRDGKVRRQCTLIWQFSIMVGAKFRAET
jgi:hypothetical protein